MPQGVEARECSSSSRSQRSGKGDYDHALLKMPTDALLEAVARGFMRRPDIIHGAG